MYTQAGAQLPNGATVIAARRTHEANRTSHAEAVVVALTNGLAAHPYATWRLDPDTGVVYSGDYCMTFEGAIRSYAARSGFAVETLGGGTVPAEDIAAQIDAFAHPDSEWARERREGTR